MARNPMALSKGQVLIREILLVGLLLHACASQAQSASAITTDGTLGTTIGQIGTTYNIGGGTRPGGGPNLFQSFGLFSISLGDTANFVNTSGLPTNNIISRVTGGQTSNIRGTLQTTDFPGANFFLVNPAGVIFGPTASLNVGGSFHVSTADYIRFADGARFFANLGQQSTLTAAAPTAFGFLGPSGGSISVDGSTLQVPAGQTLSLTGGDVQITGGVLTAPGGRIQIASVASSGEVPTDGNFNVGSFTNLGQISILSGSTLDVSGDSGGTVIIRGGRLIMDASSITADTFADVDGAPVAVDLQTSQDLILSSGASISATTFGAGRGGDVKIKTGGVLQLEDASFIESVAFGDGNGGDISADLGALSLTGGSRINSATFFGLGNGGGITVNAAGSAAISGRDALGNASGIVADTVFLGNGGTVSVTAASLSMSDGGTLTSRTFGPGTGGLIAVDVGNLSLTGGAAILTNTSDVGVGGDVTVNARSTNISGKDTDGNPSGIFTNSFFEGPAGNISLNIAGPMTLSGGGLIQSGSQFDPQGGNIAITADSLMVSNGSGISSQALIQDVGSVAINARSVTIDNGFISTSTLDFGKAGDVSLNVDTLKLTNGGQVATSSLNALGNGGDLIVNASKSVSISGASPTGASPLPLPFGDLINNASSGLFSSASGIGNGGQINVSSPNLQITHGGVISAVSSGTFDALGANPGNAGSVNIAVGNTLNLSNGTITTAAAEAAGGDVTITHTGSALELFNSQITTSVNGGDGKGGNITIGAVLDPTSLTPQNIVPFDIITLNKSGIHANAFGGPGGNINIFADVLLSSEPIATAITASSALSTPGTIDIHAQITNVSSEVTPLPEAPLQAATLLRASCAVRLAEGKSSSLVLAGRDGLPLEPGGLLPSPLFNGAEKTISSNDGPLDSTSRMSFSLEGSARPSQRALAWEQFQLAKAALGFGCAP